MEKNLEHYIINFKGSLDSKLCKKTISELKKQQFIKHAYSNSRTLEEESFHTDLSVSYADISTIQPIMETCWKALAAYHQTLNLHWYQGWSGFSKVRFNKYDVGTEMRTHCDHIHTLFDGQIKGVPILTILGCLNDKYEGGELIIFEDTKIDFETGDILIFPSNFLYPHSVLPVTKGTRYSFVSWSW